MKKIDARGLACPQPIMKMVAAMKNEDNELKITVDNETAKENIIRTARGKSWEILEIKSKNDEYSISIKK